MSESGASLVGLTQVGATVRIYVSSTYQDLIEHRSAVDRTLRRMGHDVIGMEQYAAEGSKPLQRGQTDVRAANVHVVIVAWRYGYVPEGDANPIRRSMTEPRHVSRPRGEVPWER